MAGGGNPLLAGFFFICKKNVNSCIKIAFFSAELTLNLRKFPCFTAVPVSGERGNFPLFTLKETHGTV
jgi:hypothetical protein